MIAPRVDDRSADEQRELVHLVTIMQRGPSRPRMSHGKRPNRDLGGLVTLPTLGAQVGLARLHERGRVIGMGCRWVARAVVLARRRVCRRRRPSRAGDFHDTGVVSSGGRDDREAFVLTPLLRSAAHHQDRARLVMTGFVSSRLASRRVEAVRGRRRLWPERGAGARAGSRV